MADPRNRNLDIHLLFAEIAYAALRDANAELAAYQVSLEGADLYGAQRARWALDESLELYGKATALKRLLTEEERQE